MPFRRRREAPPAGPDAAGADPDPEGAALAAWAESAPPGQPGQDSTFIDAEFAWSDGDETPEEWLDDLLRRLIAIMERHGVPVVAGSAWIDAERLTVELDGAALPVHAFDEDDRRPTEAVERVLARLNQVAAGAAGERRWRVTYLADAYGTAAFTTDAVAATAPWADAWIVPEAQEVTDEIVWLTSTESQVWAFPRALRLKERGSGPRPGAQYALFEAVDPRPDGSVFRCVAVDRHADQLTVPLPGKPSHVAVYAGRESLASWRMGSFSPPRPNPDAWCTLCATRQEAAAIDAATMRNG